MFFGETLAAFLGAFLFKLLDLVCCRHGEEEAEEYQGLYTHEIFKEDAEE